nr:YaiO family outer membrane beta-barrel protein [Caenimonas aquaedulcis]
MGAAAQQAPVDRVAVSAEHSSLDKGLAPWTEVSAHWLREWERHRVLDAGVARTRRFGQEDTQVLLSYATPLSAALSGAVEATASGTHRVLPRHALGGQLQYEFAPGWLVLGALKRTQYDSSRVDAGKLQLEHYFGDFSASVAWSPVRSGGTSASGKELRGAWYYREHSSVGFIASRGDEATLVAPGVVSLAPVRAFALLGKHELRPGLALTWSLHRVRQGSFYTREGASAGVQVSF